MVPARLSSAAGLTAVVALALLAPSCDRPTPVAPEGTTLSISANPTRIDLNETSQITVIARRADGTPVNEGTVINLSTDLGSIDATANTDETGVATATLQGGNRVGTATVTASSGASGEVTVEVQVGSVGAVLSLEANPNAIPRDAETSEINLVAVVQDTFGGLVPNVPVTFSTDIGSLASGGAAVFTDDSGQVIDTLTVRRADLSGLSEPFFTVTARTTGEGGVAIEEIVDIEILGGLSSLLFQATPSFVNVDTGGTISLSAQTFDGAGDPLPGINVNFLSDVGSLQTQGSIVTGADGVATDSLVVSPADLAGFVGSTFNVRAQARGLGGVVLEQSQSIRIQTGFPRAAFNVEGPPDPDVTFRDASTGQQPLSCSWDFGQGANPGSSSTCGDQFVSYTTPGNKTVTLTVSNSLGSDQTSASFTIN